MILGGLKVYNHPVYYMFVGPVGSTHHPPILYIDGKGACTRSSIHSLIHSSTQMPSVKPTVLNPQEAEKLERIAYILKTVAHPLRLGIVHLLEQHPRLNVTDICAALESEQSLVSHHLQNMKLKGILSVKRDGRSMMYSLKERDVSLIIECLENCQCNM